MTINGIVAYPVTPFAPDGRIDHHALRAIIDRLLSVDVSAIAPLGSTGEAAYLDLTEWTETAASTIAHIAGRASTVVGVSDLTTDGAVRRARIAESLGADAIMALPVSYWKLTALEVQRHFEAIAAAVRIPLMVYNNPATAGVDLSPEELWELVRDVENITMVKESSGDVHRMHRLRELSGGSLPFFNGSNPLALEAFRAGAAGWCTAAPCLIPQEVTAFHAAVVAGDAVTAERVFARIEPLLRFIVARGLPTTVKAGLDRTGIPAGVPRRPLLELDGEESENLARLIESARG